MSFENSVDRMETFHELFGEGMTPSNEFRQCLESLYVQNVTGLVLCGPCCEVVPTEVLLCGHAHVQQSRRFLRETMVGGVHMGIKSRVGGACMEIKSRVEGHYES